MFTLSQDFLNELRDLIIKYEIDTKLDYSDPIVLVKVIKHFIYMLARINGIITSD